MTAKELEDLNVAKTNRVVVNEMEGKKRKESSVLIVSYSHFIRMFSARYLLFSSYQSV